MSATNKLIISIIVLALAIGIIVGFSVKKEESSIGYGHGANIIADNVVGSNFGKAWASTTAGRILPENADREYSYVDIGRQCSSTVSLYWTTSTDLVVAGKAFTLTSSTDAFHEIGPDNLWIGEIYAITQGPGDGCWLSWFEK